MPTSLSGPDFLKLNKDAPVIDVRTPAAFAKGPIPGATNAPLFDDHEHAHVGISYKYQGRRAAMLHGLDIVGPKLRALAERMAYYAPDNTLLIHIHKRLGGLGTQLALDALTRGDLRTCCALLLRQYYDKTSSRSLAQKDPDRASGCPESNRVMPVSRPLRWSMSSRQSLDRLESMLSSRWSVDHDADTESKHPYSHVLVVSG